MNRIKIIFGIRIDGMEFPEISFADTSPLYKNIRLMLDDLPSYRYKIIVEKNIVNPVGDELRSIIHEASSEAQSFVYAFSLAADIKIFEFACKGYMQNEKDSSFIDIEQVFGSSRVTCFAQPTLRVGKSRVNRIKENMRNDYDLAKLQMFFDAATIEEPIGRFIALYALMLHHCNDDRSNDNQKKVDTAVISIDSTVAQFPSPRGGHYETIFTKLRNELSHKRNGVNMIETHNQVRANVNRFEYIVKAHMLKSID